MAYLFKHISEGWFHVSEGRDHVEIRRLSATGELVRVPMSLADFHEWSKQGTRWPFSAAQSHLPPSLGRLSTLRRDEDQGKWCAILEYLNHHDAPLERPLPAPAAPQRIIPCTALRRLYQMLRHLPASGLEEAIADEMVRQPEVLANLIEAGIDHASRYDNKNECFHDREGAAPWWPQYLDSPGSFAKWMTAQLGAVRQNPNGVAVNEAADLCFKPLDYEISPLRTTHAMFEDGRPGRSSGSGGMDLLLCRGEGVPVIGEIKAATDVGMFVALLQALVYAVELASPSQRQRLCRFYPGLSAAPKLEIYILYEQTDGGRPPKCRTQAEKVAGSLLANPFCATILGRIAFIECSVGGSPKTPSFKLHLDLTSTPQ